MNSQKQEEAAKELTARLLAHPELMEEVAGMLDEVENKAGGLVTADEAEEAFIRRMRAMGLKGLNGWAEREAAKHAEAGPPGARLGAKKKSGG